MSQIAAVLARAALLQAHLEKIPILLVLLLSCAACAGCAYERDPGIAAAADALMKLRKVQAASEVGVTRLQYGSLLIDARQSVNEANRQLAEGKLKQEINAAMEDYSTARTVWEFQGTMEPPDKEPWLSLKLKYGIPETKLVENRHFLSQSDALSRIWSSAASHVEEAGKILGDSQGAQ